MQLLTELWSKDLVPGGYPDVESLILSSVSESLASNNKLLSVDLLAQGLNPKLEQKAILLQEYLFDLVNSLLPMIQSSEKLNRRVQLMFQSMGDAASFQKYVNKRNLHISDR